MKIAVPSQGQDLEAPVDMRFGRAPFFLLVESETLKCQAVPNPSVTASGGAGVQTAQLLARSGAQVVIAGNVGPNAMTTVQAAGIEVYAARGGPVRETVEAFLRGELTPLEGATVGSHFGSGRRRGGGAGGGSDRGRGGGPSGGLGRGRGAGA